MSDDSPFPPSKRGKNPRSLANLKPRHKGDPNPNKTGFNGRTRGERVASILEGPAVTEIERAMIRRLGLPDDTPLIEAIVHREIAAAFGKSDLARKGLREQYAGKPRQQVDLSSEDGTMSPYGADSVSSKLRAEIASVTADASEATAEAPADDAGK